MPERYLSAASRIARKRIKRGVPGTPSGAPRLFGQSLPTRIPASTGSVINVSTFSGMQSALSTAAYGSIIDGQGLTYDCSGASLTWANTRNGAGTVTTLRNANLISSPTNQAPLLILGDWFRAQDITSNNSRWWGVKCENGSNIELERVVINNSQRSGFVMGFGSTSWQLWDCESHDAGQIPNDDSAGAYGVYAESFNNQSVIANFLCTNPERWAWHVFDGFNPSFPVDGLIITGSTAIHSGLGDRGGAILDADFGTVTNVKMVGLIVVDSPTGLVECHEPLSANNRLAGCVEWGSQNDPNGNFQLANMQPVAHVTTDPDLDANYRPGASSSAIDLVPVSWEGYLPATDLDGNARQTADAGCYAFLG